LTSLPVLATKVALVNLDLINQKYSLIREASNAVAKSEARVQRIVSTAERELNEAKAKLDDEKFEEKKQSVQAVVDQEVQKLITEKQNYGNKINTNINNALALIAKEKSFDLILDQSFTLGGAVDITSEFLSKLEQQSK
jgi:Skp family chaperone for outer membrane proteins